MLPNEPTPSPIIQPQLIEPLASPLIQSQIQLIEPIESIWSSRRTSRFTFQSLSTPLSNPQQNGTHNEQNNNEQNNNNENNHNEEQNNTQSEQNNNNEHNNNEHNNEHNYNNQQNNNEHNNNEHNNDNNNEQQYNYEQNSKTTQLPQQIFDNIMILFEKILKICHSKIQSLSSENKEFENHMKHYATKYDVYIHGPILEKMIKNTNITNNDILYVLLPKISMKYIEYFMSKINTKLVKKYYMYDIKHKTKKQFSNEIPNFWHTTYDLNITKNNTRYPSNNYKNNTQPNLYTQNHNDSMVKNDKYINRTQKHKSHTDKLHKNNNIIIDIIFHFSPLNRYKTYIFDCDNLMLNQHGFCLYNICQYSHKYSPKYSSILNKHTYASSLIMQTVRNILKDQCSIINTDDNWTKINQNTHLLFNLINAQNNLIKRGKRIKKGIENINNVANNNNHPQNITKSTENNVTNNNDHNNNDNDEKNAKHLNDHINKDNDHNDTKNNNNKNETNNNTEQFEHNISNVKCAICYEGNDYINTYLYSLKCGHIFCSNCIEKHMCCFSLSQNQNCPQCRQKILFKIIE